MKKSHVIFGYTNDDVITDINRTCSMITGKVNKNDTIVVGQIIGSSGTCNISKSIGNHLHLEVSNGGKMINPESIYDKKISDLVG